MKNAAWLKRAIQNSCFIQLNDKTYRILGHIDDFMEPDNEDYCLLCMDEDTGEDYYYTFDKLMEYVNNKPQDITFLKLVEFSS